MCMGHTLMAQMECPAIPVSCFSGVAHQISLGRSEDLYIGKQPSTAIILQQLKIDLMPVNVEAVYSQGD